MTTNRSGYRSGAPIPYRPDQPPQKRYGFHPAQYHKAQANDVYLQYQRQVARDRIETAKKRSERNLDGKLKINNLELVFLTINSRRWFGISQIVSVLFSHRPRSSVVTRMKMLGIEFYCGNYDELRRMKELGGVETHCSRCKLISEQDLVKLLLCFYRFTALPRGKGKISTNGLSTYLDDILREIAMGRVELGKDFQEDDTGKIDEDTWSQISERMLLKNAEKVEHFQRGPPPPVKKKDTFAFDFENEPEFVIPGSPLDKYIPRSQRIGKGQKTGPLQLHPTSNTVKKEEDATVKKTDSSKTTDSKPKEAPSSSEKSGVKKEQGKPESMSLLLPKLIRAERTKKPPRAIWPRWYPPTGEGEDKDDKRPTITLKSSPSFPLSGVSLPAIQCLLNHFRVAAADSIENKAKYMIDGKQIDPDDVKEVKIKRDTGEECIVSLEDLTFKDIKFGEDDIIQIVTRQDLEDQYNKQKSESCSTSRKNSGEQSDTEEQKEEEKKVESPPKPEPIEYTPEQLEYVQKLKESFDFPYAFPRTKVALKKEPNEYDLFDEENPFSMRRTRFPHYRRNPIVDNQIFRKLMLQKRPTLLTRKGMEEHLSTGGSYEDKSLLSHPSTSYSPDPRDQAPKGSIVRPKGSIIKPKLKCGSYEDHHQKPVSDRVQSEPAKAAGMVQARGADTTGSKESGGVRVLSDDSGTVSDGEYTDGGTHEQRNRPRKRFRKFSSSRERLGSGGSSECEEETTKPDHVYRFKFKTVSETQDYPYMSARPSSLLRLVKLDKCSYPVGCRSAPFLFDTRSLSRTLDRGPFVRQYDIEPTSENVWSGVSLWAAGDDSSDTMSDTSSNNGSSQSAPELQNLSSNVLRKIVSAGNSPVREEVSPDLSGLDILSSVAYNADRLRNTPTKRAHKDKISPRKQPIKLQVKHIRVANKRKNETGNEKKVNKTRKLDT